jgi:hypothetical protein
MCLGGRSARLVAKEKSSRKKPAARKVPAKKPTASGTAAKKKVAKKRVSRTKIAARELKPRDEGHALLLFRSKGDWAIRDLHEYFHQTNILYNRLYVIRYRLRGSNMPAPQLLISSLSLVPESAELSLRHIELRSPGSFSLEGIGEILAELRGTWRDLRYANSIDKQRQQQELTTKQRMDDLEVALKHTELVERQVDLLKKAGVPEGEIQECILRIVQPMSKMAAIERKQGVEIVEGEGAT